MQLQIQTAESKLGVADKIVKEAKASLKRSLDEASVLDRAQLRACDDTLELGILRRDEASAELQTAKKKLKNRKKSRKNKILLYNRHRVNPT